MNVARLLPALGVSGALLVGGIDDAHACAGCRNPTLAASRGGDGALDAGAFRMGASLTGTTVHVIHEAGCADVNTCTEVPVQPLYLHDQMLYPLELRLLGEYGLSEVFGIEAQVPLRLVRTSIEYTTPDGDHYEPLDAGVHHRDETVVGPADPWLLLRVGSSVDEWWLAARPGISLPIGRTEENPFALGDQGLRHQHIQLGSGTFDPVLVLEASRRFDPLELSLFAQGQASLYENSHGYRAPWRVYGGAAVGTKLVGKLSGSAGAEVLHEAAERWDGEIRQDGNLGRTELLAAVSFSQTLGTSELTLGIRVPLVRHIVTGDEPPGELSSPLTLSLAFSHVFGEDSEHHDHVGYEH
jgi:hypothetical protein